MQETLVILVEREDVETVVNLVVELFVLRIFHVYPSYASSPGSYPEPSIVIAGILVPAFIGMSGCK